jgi:hypothetical protein
VQRAVAASNLKILSIDKRDANVLSGGLWIDFVVIQEVVYDLLSSATFRSIP